MATIETPRLGVDLGRTQQNLKCALARSVLSDKDLKKPGIAGLSEAIFEKLKGRYSEKNEELGQFMPEVEKMFSLSTIDQMWKDHLKSMDHCVKKIWDCVVTLKKILFLNTKKKASSCLK